MPASVTLSENDTKYAGFELLDDLDGAFDPAVFDAVVRTVYNQIGQGLIRPSEPVLGHRDVRIYLSGSKTLFEWHIRSNDTLIVKTDAKPGFTETHVARFEFYWQSEDIRTLDSPFAVTSGSKLITVTHASHGLTTDDSVVFVGGVNVGDIDTDGLYLVESIVDADTYTVRHKSNAATSDATGGGSVTVLINPEAKSVDYLVKVQKADVT